jgi:hypothetical protein
MLLVLLPGAWAGAQTTTGGIRGFVRDTGGIPVPNVTVTARSSTQGTTRTSVSDQNGAYNLAELRPDDYVLTARRIGFSEQTRTIRVQIGQRLVENFTMGQSAVQLTAVQVTEAAPAAVETRSPEVATNVTQQQVNNLPTPSRNFLDLAQLAPGTRISSDRINGTGKTFAAGALPA